MRLLTKTFILVVLTGLFFTACNKEVKQEAQQEEISQAVKDKIFALGFGTSDIKIHEDGYLVEGDIIITPEQLDSKPGRQLLRIAETEQYHTFNLVTGTPLTITVSISDRLPASYVTALDVAISRYNEESLSLTFQRVDKNGTIQIVKAPDGAGYLASAGFPSSSGSPYRQVKINSAFLGSNPGDKFLGTIIAHEIGHCIGFRHTDWMDRSYSCGGAAVNEGQSTFGVGAVHIPGTPTGPDSRSWMLSCIRDGQNRPFNKNDKTALDYLY
jgi:hypothetical protein